MMNSRGLIACGIPQADPHHPQPPREDPVKNGGGGGQTEKKGEKHLKIIRLCKDFIDFVLNPQPQKNSLNLGKKAWYSY